MAQSDLSDDTRDVFLSHAWEDKEEYVRPLAAELARHGISYWLDEAEIKWGERLTDRVDEGLAKSRYVIVFLSQNFLASHWTKAELSAALNRENSEGEVVVLPLIIDQAQTILREHPLLQGKRYLKWDEGMDLIIASLKSRLAPAAGRGRSSAQTGPITAPASPSPVEAGSAGVEYNTATMRRLLLAAFNDEDFAIFCFDHFREVHDNFGRGMSRAEKVQRLIEYCQRRLLFDRLLPLVQAENPAQYRRFRAKLTARQ